MWRFSACRLDEGLTSCGSCSYPVMKHRITVQIRFLLEKGKSETENGPDRSERRRGREESLYPEDKQSLIALISDD